MQPSAQARKLVLFELADALIAPLENAHKPSHEGVECAGVEQEVSHAQKRYEDEQRINPVPDGWRQFRHRVRI